MRGAALVLLVVACRGGKQEPADQTDSPGEAARSDRTETEGARLDAAARRTASIPDKVTGTLTIGGQRLDITRCGPGRDRSIYVDLVTSTGTLRWVAYEDHRMFWNGAPIACTELRRSWGGATRPDGTTYVRGQLIFSCGGAVGAIRGDVAVDCGNIDEFERRLLDRSRQTHLDDLEQQRAAGSGTKPGPR